jgi:O-antigen/teichoic acid export membrane protein
VSALAAPPETGAVQTPQHARGAFTLRSFAGDAGLVMGGALVGNVFNYFFHFVVSRLLGPDHYGTLATLLGLAAMVSVVGSAVGTVAMQETARMWALHLDTHMPKFLRDVSSVAVVVALWSAAGVLLAGFALAKYLHIVQPALWTAFAAYIGVAAIATFLRGAVQGAHRFGYFAASLIGEGVLKLVLAALFVMAGFNVLGALGGIICGVVAGTLIAAVPVWRVSSVAGAGPRGRSTVKVDRYQSEGSLGEAVPRGRSTVKVDRYQDERVKDERVKRDRYREHLRFGGESLKVLSVSAALTGLLYVDMLFAKHHLSGNAAGYYGAAGTIARTIPYGVGFIGLVLMPKAAAAHHSSRHSLLHLLGLTFGLALLAVLSASAIMSLMPATLIDITYGAKFLAAAPLLRIYAVNASLLALCSLAGSYLVALRDYSIAPYLIAGLLIDAVAMALFGTTPLRLLSIAIGVNLLLLPAIALRIGASLRTAPQAPSPLAAEALE